MAEETRQENKKSDKNNNRNLEVLVAAAALVLTSLFSIWNIIVAKEAIKETRSIFEEQLTAQDTLFEKQKDLEEKILENELNVLKKQFEVNLDSTTKQFYRSFEQNQVAIKNNTRQFEETFKQNEELLKLTVAQLDSQARYSNEQYRLTLEEVSGRAQRRRERNKILSYFEGILLPHYSSVHEVYSDLYSYINEELETNENWALGCLKSDRSDKAEIARYLVFANLLDPRFLNYSVGGEIYNEYFPPQDTTASGLLVEYRAASSVIEWEEDKLIYQNLIFDSTIIPEFKDHELLEIFENNSGSVIHIREIHEKLRDIQTYSNFKSLIISTLGEFYSDPKNYAKKKPIDLESFVNNQMREFVEGYDEAKTELELFIRINKTK